MSTVEELENSISDTSNVLEEEFESAAIVETIETSTLGEITETELLMKAVETRGS